MGISLKSLSFLPRSTAKKSSTVMPLSDHDHQSYFAFNELKHRTRVSGSDLVWSVAESVKAMEKISRSVSDPSIRYGNEEIDEYLENDVELLDACNSLVAKIEVVRQFSYSRLKSTNKRLPRVERDVAVEKCWGRLKRLVAREKRRRREGDGEGKGLVGSLTHAVSTCRAIDVALTLKKRWGSGASACTGQMVELQDVVEMGKRVGDDVAEMKKRCGALVEAVGPLEEGLKKLYSRLLCTRVALLGVVSGQS